MAGKLKHAHDNHNVNNNEPRRRRGVGGKKERSGSKYTGHHGNRRQAELHIPSPRAHITWTRRWISDLGSTCSYTRRRRRLRTADASYPWCRRCLPRLDCAGRLLPRNTNKSRKNKTRQRQMKGKLALWWCDARIQL